MTWVQIVFKAIRKISEHAIMLVGLIGRIVMIVIFCAIMISYIQKGIGSFYNKYFKTDVIVYEPAISAKYIKFLEEKNECRDKLIIFTKADKWNPSAQIKQCPSGKLVHWTSDTFSYEETPNKPIWAINYEKNDIENLVYLCSQVYRESGLSGLKLLSMGSYKALSVAPSLRDLEKCAIVDIFSNKIDTLQAGKMGFPTDKYFSVIAFQKRILPYLKYKMSFSMNEANRYINAWEMEVKTQMAMLQSSNLATSKTSGSLSQRDLLSLARELKNKLGRIPTRQELIDFAASKTSGFQTQQDPASLIRELKNKLGRIPTRKEYYDYKEKKNGK